MCETISTFFPAENSKLFAEVSEFSVSEIAAPAFREESK